MALRRDPSRARKGIATTEVFDVGSAPVDAQREQTPPIITMEEFKRMREEMRELRTENQTIKKEMARKVSQTSSPAPLPSHATTSKKTTRRRLNDKGVSVYKFLKLKKTEFKEKEGDDPQEFLEETEKMTKILSCSDARIIELVKTKMKKTSWEWF